MDGIMTQLTPKDPLTAKDEEELKTQAEAGLQNQAESNLKKKK